MSIVLKQYTKCKPHVMHIDVEEALEEGENYHIFCSNS